MFPILDLIGEERGIVIKVTSIFSNLVMTRLSTCSVYTGLTVELEHLKIETRLTIEKFASVMGECMTER
jgi:hypothetical protein